jgi:hypothetical protein
LPESAQNTVEPLAVMLTKGVEGLLIVIVVLFVEEAQPVAAFLKVKPL